MESVAVRCSMVAAPRGYFDKYTGKMAPCLSDIYGTGHVLQPYGIEQAGKATFVIGMQLEQQTAEACLVVFPSPALNTGATKAWVEHKQVTF